MTHLEIKILQNLKEALSFEYLVNTYVHNITFCTCLQDTLYVKLNV